MRLRQRPSVLSNTQLKKTPSSLQPMWSTFFLLLSKTLVFSSLKTSRAIFFSRVSWMPQHAAGMSSRPQVATPFLGCFEGGGPTGDERRRWRGLKSS